MREISCVELRRIQLHIMDEIHAFCKMNRLRYFLMYGSLIGAVRHNGFIPWDDDIDIIMPRPDYEFFIKNFKAESMSVYSEQSIPDWPLLYSKVCDNRTRLIEDTGIETGVFVDVFPLDGMSSDIDAAKRHFKKVGRLRLAIRMHRFSDRMIFVGANFHDKVLFLVSHIINVIFKYDFLLRIFQKKVLHFSYNESLYCSDLCAGTMNRIFRKELFDSVEEHSFEGRLYMIPSGYDECLQKIYGDYMTLPPESSRCSNHNFVSYWIIDDENCHIDNSIQS